MDPSANPFDAFDTPAAPPVVAGNPFDAFDPPAGPPGAPTDAELAAEANAIVMPNRMLRHTGQVNPVTLPTAEEARTALAPDPNATYGTILPFAKDKTSGEIRWALPEVLRGTATGLLDLAQGPGGMIMTPNGLMLSPEASSALFDVATGGMGRSVAAGSGKRVAEAVSHGGALDDLYRMNREPDVTMRITPGGAATDAPAPPSGQSAMPLFPDAPPAGPARQVAPDAAPPAPPAASAPDAPPPAAPAAPARSAAPAPPAAAAAAASPEGEVVHLPSGWQVPVQYEVVDASTLRTSNAPDGSRNPLYPPWMQPRDRGKGTSALQVTRMANELNPALLGKSPTADGTPIVLPNGVVASGNGRTAAINVAYKRGGPEAARYRAMIEKEGYDTTGIERPVLVRRLGEMSDEDAARFAQEANAETKLAMGAAEQAAVDGSRLDAATLNLYRGGDVGSAENADFVRAFMANVTERGQEGALSSGDNTLTLQGADRIRNALTHKAYGEGSLVLGLAETDDAAIRAFGGGMMDAAGPVAKLRDDIAAGRVDPGVDISKGLDEAVQAIKTARDGRVPLRDVVGQGDVFGEGVSEQAKALLVAAYGPELTGRMNRKGFSALLTDYARLAGEQQAGPMLFGAPLGWRDLLKAAGARTVDDGMLPAGGAVPAPAASGAVPAMAGAGAPAPAPAMAGAKDAGAAATPRGRTGMGRKEAAASQATGDRYFLRQTALPNDRTEYIKGIRPSEAEIKLEPELSKLDKLWRQEHPAEFLAKEAEENRLYVDFYDDMAGTPTQVNTLRAELDDLAERQLRGVWTDKLRADVQPVREHIEAVLDGPEGQRAIVARELQGILDRLTDRKGKAVTDPEILYGVRKHINDLLSKEAAAKEPEKRLAAAALINVRDELDTVIEGAASGFKNYLREYSEAARPIDAMEQLQKSGERLGLGASRTVSFSQFDKLMRDLVRLRAARGTNQAKAITDEQWEALVGMHRSLQRRQTVYDQAKTPNSDTSQMLSMMAKTGETLAHAAAAALLPAPLAVPASFGIRGASKALSAGRQKRMIQRHLYPNIPPNNLDQP